MSDMIELMLLGQLGVVVHYLQKWVVANQDNQKYDLKKALPMAALSSLTTGILVYLKDDISNLYVITRFSAVVLGYLGNHVFFKFVNTVKPNMKKIRENYKNKYE